MKSVHVYCTYLCIYNPCHILLYTSVELYQVKECDARTPLHHHLVVGTILIQAQHLGHGL